MNFLNPFALIGLISIPVIIAFYLLKQKYIELTLPSLYLWRAAVGISEAQKPWQKLRKNLLMLLQILLAALIVLATADPFLSGQGVSSSRVFVLDCSMSMGATDIASSRFEAAKRALSATINSMSSGDRASIIAMQKNPYIAASTSGDKQQLLSALNEINLSQTAADFDRTTTLIQSLNPDGASDVFCYTDDPALSFGETAAEKIVFGESVQNTAITLLSHRIEEDQLILMAKVKNFGAASVSNALVFYLDGMIQEISDFSLNSGEEKEIILSGLPVAAAEIEVKLSEPDFLAADDTAFLTVNIDPPKKVFLMTEGNLFLENMLGILPEVVLYKGTSTTAEALSGYFLYVFDGQLPENLPADGHILLFNPPEGNAVIETGAAAELSGTKDATALFEFMQTIDFAIGDSKRFVLPAWTDESFSVGGVPVIAAGEENGRKIMVVGFDLHNTDLPFKKDFPVFIYNLFRWFAPENGGIVGDALCGDSLLFEMLPNARGAQITAPDGEKTAIAPPFPPDPFEKTEVPGIYTLAQQTEKDEIQTKFAVNAFYAAESDLYRAADENGQAAVTVKILETRIDLRNWVLGLILIVVILEWWVYSRAQGN